MGTRDDSVVVEQKVKETIFERGDSTWWGCAPVCLHYVVNNPSHYTTFVKQGIGKAVGKTSMAFR